MRQLAPLGLVAVASCQLVFPLEPQSDAPLDGGMCAADLMIDSMNCGACGHDCHQGACLEGVCQPVELASGQKRPINLAQTVTHIYWVESEGGTVRRVLKDGTGNVETLRSQRNLAVDVAVDATRFYWTENTGVFSCPIDGCGVNGEIMHGACTSSVDVALSKTVVFWTCPASRKVLKISKTVAGQMDIDDGEGDVKHIVVEGADVFWAGKELNRIRTSRVDGSGGTNTLVSAPAVDIIAADPNGLYWGGFDATTINLTTRPNNITSVLANTQSNVESIFVHDGIVFWVGGRNTGYLRACAAAGCDEQPTTIFAPIDVPVDVVVDDADIFYSTDAGAENGTIMRLAR